MMNRTILIRPVAVLAVVVLVGCASSPVTPDGRTVSPTGPAHVLDDASRVGETVIWGGRIVATHNLPDRTEIEVASYPLTRNDRPRLNAEPGVRFIIEHAGYLEQLSYAPGRFVTVLGVVAGVDDRHVGDYAYRHPVLTAEDIHLWPADARQWDTRPRFSIGVGVRL